MLYKNKFVSELAVANQSGAMEAETISKNGANKVKYLKLNGYEKN